MNCPYRSKVTNYQRDGPQAYDNQGSAPNYYPNSYSGPEQQPHLKMSTFNVSGDVAKYEIYMYNNLRIFFLTFRKFSFGITICLNFIGMI